VFVVDTTRTITQEVWTNVKNFITITFIYTIAIPNNILVMEMKEAKYKVKDSNVIAFILRLLTWINIRIR